MKNLKLEFKDDMDNIHSLISAHKDKKNSLYLYTVDMNEAFNKEYISESSNRKANNAGELKISGTTLIHFKDNKIVEYLTEDLEKYLK